MTVGDFLKRHPARLIFGLACLILFLGHATQRWQMPFVTAIDAYLYDARLRLSMPGTVDDRVVIVDIDEKSMAEQGRWPWNREKMSTLVRRITDDYGAAVVGFDVVFAEPDESSGLGLLERIGQNELRADEGYRRILDELRPGLDYDSQFAQTLKGRPVILGAYFTQQSEARISGVLPPPVFPPDYFKGRGVAFSKWNGYGGNLPAFQEAAAGGGHFTPSVDFDGVTRRVPLLAEYDGNYYEALSIAILREYLGGARLRLAIPNEASGPERLDILAQGKTHFASVDAQVAALIPYRGEEHSFPYVSASDLLNARVPPERFRGRIVIVGTSAPGLNDLRSTPVGAAYPGVEIHANLITGILDGKIKHQPGYVGTAETLTLIFLGGLMVLCLPLLSPSRATLLTLAGMLLVVVSNFWLWQSANLVFPLASTLLLLFFLYLINMAMGFFVESRSRRLMTLRFGQYVPPELVEKMAQDPKNYSMEGRDEELSILFSDVRGFTTISEQMDPKELTLLMNAYLGAMTEIIHARRGTLDKYIGDAIMAFWGAPTPDPRHVRHAIETALEMQHEIHRLEAPFQAKGWPLLRIGIGINTGVVAVGDMGSSVRQAYTVMGDAVNLASRLEGITKEYGVGIAVGEAAWEKTRELFLYRELDRVRAKGKQVPVGIYEPLAPLGEAPQETLDELADWNQALEDYRACRWDAAQARLTGLSERFPERRLYALYLERIAHYRTAPPEKDWDGVTTFQTK